jgi:hypothetical protein
MAQRIVKCCSHHGSRDSSVGIMSRLRAGQPANELNSRQEKECFFSTAFSTAPRPTQSLCNGYQRLLSPIIKRPRCEADHSDQLFRLGMHRANLYATIRVHRHSVMHNEAQGQI